MKKIEVLGIGCARCEKTEKIIRETVTGLGLTEGKDYILEKIKNPSEIASRGVLMTPGVSIDGKIVLSGKIPGRSLVESWFKN